MPGDPLATLRRLRWLPVLGLALLWAAGMRHHLVWGESAERPWQLPLLNALEGACLVGFAALAGIGWWRALRTAQGVVVDVRALVRVSAPVLVAAVLVPCFLTADPIDYVVRGRILAVHGGNPYVDVATDYPADPFLTFGDRGWKDMPLPYGPVVADVQAAVAWLAHLLPVSPRVELIAALTLFKLVFAAALVAAAVLFARVAARLRRGAEAAAFVAVAWNPLLLDDCVANAHNEPLVMLALAAATLAALSSRFAAATVALALGAMTKVVPALLGPPWLALAARRGRLRDVAAGVAISAAIFLVFYWQLFAGVDAGDALRRQSGLTGASVWWAVHRLTGADLATLGNVGRGVVVAWVLWCSARLWRRTASSDSAARELVFTAASSLLMLAVFGAALFGTWYHAWWLPFGLLLGAGYLRRAAVATSLLAPLAYLPWAAARRFDEPAQWWILGFGVVLPLLAAALVGRGRATAAGAEVT